MVDATKKNGKRNETIFMNIKEISKSATQEDVQALVDVIDNEIGSHKLSKEEKEHLQEIMNVDAIEALKWKNVADVLKYLSVFAIAESNPEAIKKATQFLLSIVGTFYPAANLAGGLLANVPDKLFLAIIKIGGFASPEYLIYRGAKRIATEKTEKAKAQAEYDTNEHENMVNLIIVCKSKFLSEEMSKLVDTNDDIDEETIVGTKDGSVHTIVWNEAAWEAYRDRLTIDDKVLIIGKVKNTTPLTLEQIRFNEFGVKYGWNNNTAIIEADPQYLINTKEYNKFLSAINDLQVSAKMKKNVKLKFDLGFVAKLALFPPLLVGDALHENTAVKEQQLLFGLHNMYIRDLSEFLTQNNI